MINKISILIPVYNEESNIESVLDAVSRQSFCGLEPEVIVVDDGSHDNSYDVLTALQKKYNFKLLRHNKNKGKGAAIKSALHISTGEIIIIQDADLEYDPAEIKDCISPIIENKSLVVYGSRRLNKDNKEISNFLFLWGGTTHFVTPVSVPSGSPFLFLFRDPLFSPCFSSSLSMNDIYRFTPRTSSSAIGSYGGLYGSLSE